MSGNLSDKTHAVVGPHITAERLYLNRVTFQCVSLTYATFRENTSEIQLQIRDRPLSEVNDSIIFSSPEENK